MANEEYHSNYTGPEIDEGIGNSVEVHDLFDLVSEIAYDVDDVTIDTSNEVEINQDADLYKMVLIVTSDGYKIAIEDSDGNWELYDAYNSEYLAFDSEGEIVYLNNSSFSGNVLPSVTSSDSGKSLLVNNNGEWEVSELPDGLPSVSDSDKGKALLVNNTGEWEVSELPDGLPSVSNSDKGKALLVNNNGKWSVGSIPEELPSVSNLDQGKALLVNNNGKWSVGSIPKELPTITSNDEGKVLVIDSSGNITLGTIVTANSTLY